MQELLRRRWKPVCGVGLNSLIGCCFSAVVLKAALLLTLIPGAIPECNLEATGFSIIYLTFNWLLPLDISFFLPHYYILHN